jgi:hypothetical protein
MKSASVPDPWCKPTTARARAIDRRLDWHAVHRSPSRRSMYSASSGVSRHSATSSGQSTGCCAKSDPPQQAQTNGVLTGGKLESARVACQRLTHVDGQHASDRPFRKGSRRRGSSAGAYWPSPWTIATTSKPSAMA